MEDAPDLNKMLLHLTSSGDEGIKGLSDIMKISKGNAQIVVDSWKKADGLGCTLKKKAFPSNSKRPDVYNGAKAYQGKISGNPDLSFEKNGVSFDAIEDGKLIDAKYGYGKSTFQDILDEELEKWIPEVINNDLSGKLLIQATKQVNAIKGTSLKIEWFVSNELAQKGITKLFEDNTVDIVVKYLKP